MNHTISASVVSGGSNYLHNVRIRHFDLPTDEPRALGGHDRGPSPFEYFLASLSACSAITLQMYAQKKGWKLGAMRVDLVLNIDGDGKVHIHRTLHSDQALTDAQWSRLLEVVANTPVTKTMREGVVITSTRGD